MILSIRGLEVSIFSFRGVVPAVRGVDLDVERGEVLGIVGESGCGKSTLVHAIARLLPRNAVVKAEKIELSGIDLTRPDEKTLRDARAKHVAYIFQDPQVSLNPVMKISEQMEESILVAEPDLNGKELEERGLALLNDVRIHDPKTCYQSYPHQLSGGMKQRVMAALALARKPSVLIADEPTTSLDVTVQSEILTLIRDLNAERNMTVLYITHDLAVARKICGRIAVMYAGKIAEIGASERVFTSPAHPYTHSLWRSIPSLEGGTGEKLMVIPGTVPNPSKLPGGCKFHPRCYRAGENCDKIEPALAATPAGGHCACHYPLA